MEPSAPPPTYTPARCALIAGALAFITFNNPGMTGPLWLFGAVINALCWGGLVGA